ncbi:hypothetical protein ACSTLX_25610, partial [Vibrio parahaemolyticus]
PWGTARRSAPLRAGRARREQGVCIQAAHARSTAGHLGASSRSARRRQDTATLGASPGGLLDEHGSTLERDRAI